MARKFNIGSGFIHVKPGMVIATNNKLPVDLRSMASKSGFVEGKDYVYASTFAETKELIEQNKDSKFFLFECIGEHYGNNEYLDKHAIILSCVDHSIYASKLGEFSFCLA